MSGLTIENFRERYGVSLNIVLHALDCGIYVSKNSGRKYPSLNLFEKSLVITKCLKSGDVVLTHIPLSEFGKTWSLTKTGLGSMR